MRELFTLIGRIAIDNKDANASIDETAEKGRGAESKLSSAFSKAGSAAVKVGKAVATGLAAGATAMTALVGSALDAGGSLEQNIGGSEAVFKQHAQGMQDTADEAYKNMGLSASDFLATANKMGALFQGSGFGIKESAELSAEAMQRAADVASIMGIDTASAMEAVAGAAKGNYTMMDNLGVAMNETALEAYALSKGIEKSTKDMSQQEKTALAMEMFLEKTAYAAGNYAKENETLAGALGTAKSAMANFLSGAGDASQVATAFTNAGKVVIENVRNLLPGLVGGLKELITALVPEIPPLLDALLPAIIEGAVALVDGIVAALPAITGAVMKALPALLDGMMQIFNALIAALPQVMETLIAALPALIPQLVNGIVALIVALTAMMPQIIQPIIAHLPEIVQSVADALLANLPILLQGFLSLIKGIVAATPQLIAELPAIIIGIVNFLTDSIPLLVKAGVDLLVALVKDLPAIITEVVKAIPLIIVAIVGGIMEAVPAIVKAGGDLIKGLWQGISDVGNWLNEKISGFFGGVVTKIKDFFGIHSPSRLMAGIGRNLGEGIGVGFEDSMGKVSDDMQNAIPSALDGPAIDVGAINPQTAGGSIQGISNRNVPGGGDFSPKGGTALYEIIYSAFARALEAVGIKLDVELVPDESGIFESVRISNDRYKKTTGGVGAF